MLNNYATAITYFNSTVNLLILRNHRKFLKITFCLNNIMVVEKKKPRAHLTLFIWPHILHGQKESETESVDSRTSSDMIQSRKICGHGSKIYDYLVSHSAVKVCRVALDYVQRVLHLEVFGVNLCVKAAKGSNSFAAECSKARNNIKQCYYCVRCRQLGQQRMRVNSVTSLFLYECCREGVEEVVKHFQLAEKSYL